VTHALPARLPLLAGAVLAFQAAAFGLGNDGVSQQAHWAGAEQGVTLELAFSPPQVEQVEGQVILRLPGEGLIGEPGAPDLPLVRRLVRMPARSGVQLEILEEVWQPWQVLDLRPVQERVHTVADLPLPWAELPAIYGSDTPWPEAAVALGEPMILRDQRLVALDIAPLRWNPATGLVERLESLQLRLAFTGENPVNALERVMPPSPLMTGLAGPSIIAPPAAEGALADVAWQSPALPLDYLVYTPASALANGAFQDWLDWKHRKGHRITVVSSDQIPWTATGIRNSILGYYNGDTPPDFVMLVGDVDGGNFVTPTHGTQFDHYYAAISGTDVLADVVVGRISVRSSTHLNTVFNKILAYEKNPDLNNPNWLRRASFLTGQGHCGLSMSQLSRAAAFSLVENFGYTQIDTAFCARSPEHVYNWYNSGTSYHNYRGISGMENLSTNQIQNLTQGRRTPIAVIFTCNSGDFAIPNGEPAFTEAFLRAGNASTPGGASAAMGFCTPNTHTAYNNIVCGGFWYGILDLGLRQVGTAMFRGKYELYLSLPQGDSNVANFSYWANLMGDPGMNLWVGVPDVLQFAEAPLSVSASATRLEAVITTTGGDPVEGAVVCASQPDGFRVLALSGSDGRVVLTLPQLDPGAPLWLTASRDDHVPVLRDYSLTPAGSLPTVSDPVLLSGGLPWARPGSSTSLQLTVHNPMDVVLSGGTVTLALDGGRGTVQTATADLPVIGAGQSAPLASPLQFTVDPDVSANLPLFLDLQVSWSGGSVSHRLQADLRHPFLELLDPDLGGLALEPGNTRVLQIRLGNSGLVDGSGLELVPSFPVDSPFSTPGTVIPLDLAAGAESGPVEIPVTLDGLAFRGSLETLTLQWSAGGASGQVAVPVRASTGDASDPSGPDAWGYTAWEDGDDGPLAMEYSWVEIAPAAGGSGTVLNLTDFGDEQDDATMVTLPFAFTLYGESYTVMSVCSNGFVGFGPDSHLETDFRNHNLPGAMGPQPMLAVMWDDHKITNGAQVCVKHLEDSHIYVVEWYRVRGNSVGGPNTFQLLLLDPAHYPTPGGDGDFIFQYHTFLNNQSNDQDFPYCSIGIEDHTGTRGLGLTNYSVWSPTCTPITGTRAIRFSTLRQASAGGELAVLDASLQFHLPGDAPGSLVDSLHLGNTGNGLLNWNLRVVPEGNWPPALQPVSQGPAPRDGGGPDPFGYTWVDSRETDGPQVQWVDTPGALPVDFVFNDQASGPFPIGFPMPFYGSSFDSLYISPNGYISFSDGGNHWNNSVGLPHSGAPDNAVCAWWDDLLQDGNLSGFVSRYHGADSLVVAWSQAPHSSPGQYGGPFSFQIILEANGRITVQYGDMSDANPESDSGTIGLQGPGTGDGLSVSTNRPARSDYAVSFRPPFWLEAPVTSGILGPGDTVAVPLLAGNGPSGTLLAEGVYTASLVVESGGQGVTVPVTLTVGEVAVPYGDDNALPGVFSLGTVWPNPFNPATRVRVHVADTRPFTLELFNLRGQRVQTLYSGSHAPGTLELDLDGSALASGVYLLGLRGEGIHDTRKIALVR
jgi:hypothetical protein